MPNGTRPATRKKRAIPQIKLPKHAANRQRKISLSAASKVIWNAGDEEEPVVPGLIDTKTLEKREVLAAADSVNSAEFILRVARRFRDVFEDKRVLARGRWRSAQ